MRKNLLCLNAGSSSLKFALFQEQDGQLSRCHQGAVEHLKTERSLAWSQDIGSPARRQHFSATAGHEEAVEFVLATLEVLDMVPHGVGHRVVHGGAVYSAPVLIDDVVLSDLRSLIPFAPLHQSQAIGVIQTVARRFPTIRQVACFDTAIHRHMPEIAQRFPLPERMWDEGIRRYGFHGLSFEHLLSEHAPLKEGRTVIAHLGHGASLAAFFDGQPQDTTMGFTPTGGLMMGTRCGDIDPGILLYLIQRHGYRPQDIDHLINHDSGLRGVSGTTSDMQALQEEAETNPRAAEAIRLYCRSLCKHIGAMVAVLGGLDRLVFTAGIGQHSALVREHVCRQLAHLGIELDEELNRRNARDISRSSSRCAVHVFPTDEEQTIVLQTLATLQ